LPTTDGLGFGWFDLPQSRDAMSPRFYSVRLGPRTACITLKKTSVFRCTPTKLRHASLPEL
jgi:hypothetical protein